ncbi:MazG-like family protein, partial [Anaerosalibacter bizertensis]|nr:MazG-like family protein [Anaerosalibacter bizertensis]
AKGVENTKDDILDIISNVILVSYLLGKRLGLSYETINLKVENKIKLGMIEEHKIEKWYGDLSELNENFSNRRGE